MNKVCDFFNNQRVQYTLVKFKVQQKCINVQCIFYTKSIVFVYQMVYIISRLNKDIKYTGGVL